MLSKETDQSSLSLEPWMESTQFTFTTMSTANVQPKSSLNLPVSSPGLPNSSPGLPNSPALIISPSGPISSPEVPRSTPGQPKSSPGPQVSSPGLPLDSPGLPTSAILSPSQIKQEPLSSILVTELLSRDSTSNSCYSNLQLKNNRIATSSPSAVVVCKREPSGVKTEQHSGSCLPNKTVRVKEEYPDLSDMVGVDKTTYLEFLNNPILPSISEVEQLLEQCSGGPMSLCRPHDHVIGCVHAMTDYGAAIKIEPRHHLTHQDSSLSPSYQTSYMDTSFSDEDPSLWHGDLTPLMPIHGHDIKPRDIKTDVAWHHDVSNGGYDSSGPIESPRSTGSLESDEAESRLPTAVENMDDVGVMTSQLEESNRLTYDDDFGPFDVDEKAFKKRRKGLHLWEFLLEVLDDDRYVPHLLYWVERSKGIFKIEKSQEVAKLWGRRKQRSHMTYEHMSRAMRHYYSSGIMRRIPGKRLMYQFGPRAFATSKTSS